jgi:hypothetical protein
MRELDVVRLIVDLPDEGLHAGTEGTIVYEYPAGYLVEFFDDNGDTITVSDVEPDQIRVMIPYNPSEHQPAPSAGD